MFPSVKVGIAAKPADLEIIEPANLKRKSGTEIELPRKIRKGKEKERLFCVEKKNSNKG